MKRETFLSTIETDSVVALLLILSIVFGVIFFLAALPSGMRMTLLCLGLPIFFIIVAAFAHWSAEESQAERQQFFATLAKHFDTSLTESSDEMIIATYRGRAVTVQWRSHHENKQTFEFLTVSIKVKSSAETIFQLRERNGFQASQVLNEDAKFD